MPAEPAPADPGWDDDPAWLDRDPATPAERAAWLDRVAEADEPPEPEEYEDFGPLTAAEGRGCRVPSQDSVIRTNGTRASRLGSWKFPGLGRDQPSRYNRITGSLRRDATRG